jgi:hypothetical protein
VANSRRELEVRRSEIIPRFPGTNINSWCYTFLIISAESSLSLENLNTGRNFLPSLFNARGVTRIRSSPNLLNLTTCCAPTAKPLSTL